MNITETKAKRWLEAQGYKVHYFAHTTPDFRTVDGHYGFEVKLIRNRTVTITERQLRFMLEFRGELRILAFEWSEDSPKVLTLEELMMQTKGVIPKIVPERISISVDKELWELVKLAAKAKRQKLGAWVEDALLDALERQYPQ